MHQDVSLMSCQTAKQNSSMIKFKSNAYYNIIKLHVLNNDKNSKK